METKKTGLVPRSYGWGWGLPSLFSSRYFPTVFDYIDDVFGRIHEEFPRFGGIMEDSYEGSNLVSKIKLGDLKAEDVEITVGNGMLTVEGKHCDDQSCNCSYIKVQRSVPKDLDDSKIEAEVKGGELVLTLKDFVVEKELPEVKKIDIKPVK